MKAAIIENGKVANIAKVASVEDAEQLGWYAIQPEQQIEKGYNVATSSTGDVSFSAPGKFEGLGVDEAKAKLKERATEKRRAKQAAGLTINGAPVDTDANSVSTMTSALVALEKGAGGNPKFPASVNWRLKNGQFTQLDKSALEDIAGKVTNYVQACFDAEMTHSAAIEALTTLDELEAYDLDAGWPDSDLA